MKNKSLFLLPCIAAVVIATFVGTKAIKWNANECEELLLANVEALSVGDYVGDAEVMVQEPGKGLTVYWLDFDPDSDEILMETDWENRVKTYGKKKKVFSNTIESCCKKKYKECLPFWTTCNELRCPPVKPSGTTDQHIADPGDALFVYRYEEF